jgi:electron transport complex protein RnfC
VDSTIKRIDKGQFWKFHGGIHPPEQKFITDDKPIRNLALPKELILPLQQHIGQAGKLIVEVGQHVLKGQPLTESNHPMAVPIHAPTSGTVTKLAQSIIAHPSGFQENCLFLTPDGEEKWYTRNICSDYTALDNSQLIVKIENAGISGMGGAGFPTHIKVNNSAEIEYLIINAAECEPYITADDLLIRENSTTIIDGINILHQIISPKIVLIGIENNKPKAIQALRNATKNLEHIKICVIPTKYPSGGEKQLIQILTGKEIPSGSLPSSQGIVMQNIATCYAIADAVINDIPLIKRVTTVTGLGLTKPQNIWALLGTPVSFLLEQCEYHTQDTQRVIMGGPMMGFSLPSGNVPVVKTTNCILAPSEKEISLENDEVECIRCGQCAEACPAQLLPQELQWSAKAKDYNQLDKLNLFDCIECGACAYVCPSHIPLVHYYRIGKAEIRELKQQEIKAEKAKIRFEARKARLDRDKKAREEKQRVASEARKARMNSGTTEANGEMSAVAAALARVKAKKASSQSGSDNVSTSNDRVAAAVARAKAKKLAAQNKIDSDSKEPNSIVDSKPAASNDPSVTTVNKPDDKKAKIAATIAKAKAKKLAAQNNATADEATPEVAITPVTETPNAVEDTTTDKAAEKKAKIAATIAKAKAKAKKLTAENKDKLKTSAPKLKESKNSSEKKSVAPQNTDKKIEHDKPNATSTINKIEPKIEIVEEVAKPDVYAQPDVTIKTEDKLESEVEITKELSTKIESNKENDKQAKIAAAVAKARAKKKSDRDDKEKSTPEDDKKKRIAAAVAKAKAKKQQRSELT